MKQMNKSDSFFIGTDSQIKTDSGVGPTMNLGFTPYTGKNRYNKDCSVRYDVEYCCGVLFLQHKRNRFPQGHIHVSWCIVLFRIRAVKVSITIIYRDSTNSPSDHGTN